MGEKMGKKILIVEDELDLLDLVDFNLTRKGFFTMGVLNGAEAFELYNAFGPDVVILDLMLPGLDGWELCRRIKGSGGPARVLMLTAKCMDEDRQKGYEAGADDYMTKPFNIRELVMRVERLLGPGKLSA